MPASNTVTNVVPLAGGYVLEYGTFTSSGGTTTLTITAADASANYTADYVEITDILQWGFASDGDTAILPAKDVALNAIKITFTANDSGDYWLVGKAR